MEELSNAALVQALHRHGLRAHIERRFDPLAPVTGARSRVVLSSGAADHMIGHCWFQTGRGLVILGLFSGVVYLVETKRRASHYMAPLHDAVVRNPRAWQRVPAEFRRRCRLVAAHFYELRPGPAVAPLETAYQGTRGRFSIAQVKAALDSLSTVGQYSRYYLQAIRGHQRWLVAQPGVRGRHSLAVAVCGMHHPVAATTEFLRSLADALSASAFDLDWGTQVDYNDPYYQRRSVTEAVHAPRSFLNTRK